MQRLAGLVAQSAQRRSSRAFAAAATPLKATLFPGDGVGPEISDAVSLVLRTAGVPVEWDVQKVGDKPDPRTNSFITRENLDSVKARARALRTRVVACAGLKGCVGVLTRRRVCATLLLRRSTASG